MRIMNLNSDGVIKAVIFDLDDTLVSEYEFVVSGYRYMSERLSKRLGKSAEDINAKLWELSEKTYARVFNRLFEAYGVPLEEEELKELIHIYRDHPAGLHFYEDVYPTLKGLKERGMLTGIISDGDPKRQWNKINSAVGYLPQVPGKEERADRVSFFFDEIVLNDEFGGAEFRKPDPKGFITICERLKIDPSEMIYVGDNPAKDFYIASCLPVRTARIIRDKGIYRDREYLNGIRETRRIDKLTDILEMVDIKCESTDTGDKLT